MLINFSRQSKFVMKSFLNAVNGFKKNIFFNARVHVIESGTSTGVLKGGNLISLTSLIGTKWEIDTAGAILFFEDVSEKLHAIERCFIQWYIAGKLKKIKGLILGSFGFPVSEVYKRIKNYVENVPVVYVPSIGHVSNMITLPVGAFVKLESSKKTLHIVK